MTIRKVKNTEEWVNRKWRKGKQVHMYSEKCQCLFSCRAWHPRLATELCSLSKPEPPLCPSAQSTNSPNESKKIIGPCRNNTQRDPRDSNISCCSNKNNNSCRSRDSLRRPTEHETHGTEGPRSDVSVREVCRIREKIFHERRNFLKGAPVYMTNLDFQSVVIFFFFVSVW